MNTGIKVTHLNADAVDGLSSGSFARTSGQFGVITVESVFMDADEDGTDDSLWAVAECPTGTKLTGGGIDNFSSGFTFFDSPFEGAWYAVSSADPSVDATDDVVGYAICYNPTGAVPGAQTFTAKAKIPAEFKERVATAMKHRN